MSNVKRLINAVNEMSVNIKTIIEDIKASLGLARQNVLSYFLATLGLLVLMGLIIAAYVVPILAVAVGFDAARWSAIGAQLAAMNTIQNGWVLLASLIMLPVGTLFFTILGAIFGMSMEVVETGTTHAETAFSSLRHKALALAGAGLILTLVIMMPPLWLHGLVAVAMGLPLTGIVNSAVSIISFVWIFMTIGIMSMVIPGVLQGKGVQEAVVDSVHLARAHYDRVYGVLSGVLVIIILSFAPAIVAGLAGTTGWWIAGPTPALAGLGLWMLLVGLAWVLLLFPMVTIVITRVYYVVAKGDLPVHEQESIPIV